MKKYLMGLGAMLVGASLMFVLMHGEVSADARPEPCVCSDNIWNRLTHDKEGKPIKSVPIHVLWNCKCGNQSCAIASHADTKSLARDYKLSCHKDGGLFK
jgi:hypothetical protein